MSRISFISCVTVAFLVLVGARSAPADNWTPGWLGQPDRTWVGPDFWTNRLQDWRFVDDAVECREGRPRFPLRTAMLLTGAMSDAPQAFIMQVWSEPIGPRTGNAFRGLLLGAGGQHVDYRLSAQVHHRPAADGGLLAVVDDTGRVALRRNDRPIPGGNQWSVAGAITDDALPPLPVEREAYSPPLVPPGRIHLVLSGVPTEQGYELTLTSFADAGGAILDRVTARNVGPGLIDGAVGLVSHLGQHRFRDWHIDGSRFVLHPERAYGPVLGVQYTVGDRTLKLTAQMGPIGDDDARTARLEIAADDGDWIDAGEALLDPDARTFRFRVDDWDTTRAHRYRLRYELQRRNGQSEDTLYEGVVTREPTDARELVVGSLNCHKVYTGNLAWNHDGLWFPHRDTVEGVRSQTPDLLFFAGDQIYEGDLDPAQRSPLGDAMLDYLYKWYRWCWAFGDLTRSTPTVTIPDDHDVYHGNLWGAGGKKAEARNGLSAQDSGGYVMPPAFVNMVHRTQTSHLPDPVDPAPIEQTISVYFTRLDWAGVSFAILADRQFKSSASVLVPEGKVRNGWFQAEDFDPATQADVPGAVLLGERQLAFLERWANDWSNGTWMKVVLSQTLFANVATIPEKSTGGSVLPNVKIPDGPEHPEPFKLAADTDSNAWPQTGRNRAVGVFRRALAVHLAGDQHLGSLIEYGIDAPRDAGFAFCAPAIANTWPRRWHPPVDGANRAPGAPRWTGDFTDGFGLPLTVWAVANPYRTGVPPHGLHDRCPGFGVVTFDRPTRDITFHCWPRWVRPTDAGAEQYPGWPRRVPQMSGHGPTVGALPLIKVIGADEPLVRVVDQRTGKLVFTFRSPISEFRIPVPGPGPYTVWLGERGRDGLHDLEPGDSGTYTVRVRE